MLSNTGLLREMWISDINYFYDNTNTTVKQFYAPITVTYLIYLFFLILLKFVPNTEFQLIGRTIIFSSYNTNFQKP